MIGGPWANCMMQVLHTRSLYGVADMCFPIIDCPR